jgi:hypothetical protein
MPSFTSQLSTFALEYMQKTRAEMEIRMNEDITCRTILNTRKTFTEDGALLIVLFVGCNVLDTYF